LNELPAPSFRYANRTEHPVRITVEPWAEQFVIRPGQHVEIRVEIVTVSRNPSDACVEIAQIPDGLIIYGFEGCIISMWSNGEELVPDDQV
jgi:hypothetical protein